MRFHPEDLECAYLSKRFTRVLDGQGYATLMRCRIYGEEGLAGKEADLWLLGDTLTLEHAGEPISAYGVAHDAGSPGARGRSGRLLEKYGRRNAVEGELLVSVAPRKVVAYSDVTHRARGARAYPLASWPRESTL